MASSNESMWYEEAPYRDGWASLWHGYVLCGDSCIGIRKIDDTCPACGGDPLDTTPQTIKIAGEELVVHAAFAGAEGRYEDYIYLQMLQREWERPVVDFEPLSGTSSQQQPSAQAALVLLFWGYFETRIERLLRAGMRSLPERVLENMLRRYSSIGARLRDLYKIFFQTTYFDDLRDLGYSHVADMLLDIHERRNKFAHGNPQAVDDNTVQTLVSLIKAEHESWIAAYNRRLSSSTDFATKSN